MIERKGETIMSASRYSKQPNVIYFHKENLGYGELGCHGGGILRGADTRRIDQFARLATRTSSRVKSLLATRR